MNKMCSKLIALVSLSALALALAGCDGGQTKMGKRETNVLGIAKYQNENYSSTGPTSFIVSTDELYHRENYSGDKATFLWGFVTVKDY